MPGREPSSEGSARDAQELYSVYLRDLQEGEEVDFEEFCARNSHMAEDLRKLHWSFQLGQSLVTSRSLQQSILSAVSRLRHRAMASGVKSSAITPQSCSLTMDAIPGEGPITIARRAWTNCRNFSGRA